MSLTSFELDCTRCGACCAPRADWPTYVHVTPAEREALPARFALRVIDDELATIPDRPEADHGRVDDATLPQPNLQGAPNPRTPLQLKRRSMSPGVRCVALEGELGEAVRCAVHAARPSVCRRFRAGSRACVEARAEVLGILCE